MGETGPGLEGEPEGTGDPVPEGWLCTVAAECSFPALATV